MLRNKQHIFFLVFSLFTTLCFIFLPVMRDRPVTAFQALTNVLTAPTFDAMIWLIIPIALLVLGIIVNLERIFHFDWLVFGIVSFVMLIPYLMIYVQINSLILQLQNAGENLTHTLGFMDVGFYAMVITLVGMIILSIIGIVEQFTFRRTTSPLAIDESELAQSI